MIKYVSDLINSSKVVAIIRGVSIEHAEPLCDALIAGGVSVLEFAMDHSCKGYVKDNCDKIAKIRSKYPKIAVGAGSVLNVKEAKEMIAAGALHIVSPNTDKATIEYTVNNGIVSIPGAMTATECVQAYDAGATFVKLFPAGELGVNYVKAIIAPLSHIPFLVVGGVTLDNMATFLQLGVKGFGLGSSLILKDAIGRGDYSLIQDTAAKYIKIAAGGR